MRTLLLASLMITGCASGPFGVEVRHVGRVDPARDERVAEAAQDLPWDGSYDDVEVTSEVPAGIVLGDKIKVDDTNRWAFLGMARSFMDDTRQVAFAKSVFLFESMHPSEGGGRDVYCKIQTPLRTLTLGIWSLLSPFNWPCFVLYTKRLSKNTALHAQELRRVARAMGGNVVVVQIETKTQSYTTGYGFRTGVGYEDVPGASATAWVFLDRSKVTPKPAE